MLAQKQLPKPRKSTRELMIYFKLNHKLLPALLSDTSSRFCESLSKNAKLCGSYEN